jgi:lipoprotein-anchoring transpeptidase ErfK/SrfK
MPIRILADFPRNLLALGSWVFGVVGAAALPAASGPAAPADGTGRPPQVQFTPAYPRPVATWLEAQIALARIDFSCGCIDGVPGPKSAATLAAFQASRGLEATGDLGPATQAALLLDSAPLVEIALTVDDLRHIQPLSPTWLGKSQQTALDFATVLELVAEHAHASERLIRRLNPGIDWTRVGAGARLTVPDPVRRLARAAAQRIQITLSQRVLEVYDDAGTVIAHFPVSIARQVEKRPGGELHVTVIIPNPDYTFDPDIFPESEEARSLGRKLTLPPGPNNPVGVAWIGLDRSGYGIHGTPEPENIGITESHGCFRLTNWDARALLDLAYPQLAVFVEP